MASPRVSNCAFSGLTSIHKFAELMKCPLNELNELARRGRSNYRIFPLSKSSRLIEEPVKELKVIQRRIHDLLKTLGRPSFLFSAFSGTSAVANANRHNLCSGVVKLDIRKFYASSDGRKVREFFRNSLRCATDISELVFKLCTIRNEHKYSRPHLPTGGVSSSILSYFCYEEMFMELNSYAIRNSLTFSVMADDITFSGDGADHNVRNFAKGIIYKHGLESNDRKQRVWPANHTAKIITGSVVTPNGMKVQRSLKLKILSCQRDLRDCSHPLGRCHLYQRLVGLFTAAAQIESRYKKAAQMTKDKWKSDEAAWNAHKLKCGERKPAGASKKQALKKSV